MVIKNIKATVSDRDELVKQIRRAGDLVRELEMIFFKLPKELPIELTAENRDETKVKESE